MSQTLRVLILDSSPADVELSVHALRRAGYDVEWIHVDDRDGYAAHLSDAIDVILADYALPQFNARQALQMAQERGLSVPFLVVSGTIGEDLAVEMMKQGADDYLSKDRLARLGTAVGTALEQRRLRKERADIEEALHSQDRLFRAVVEHASDGIALVRQDMTIAYLSPATELLANYDSSELTGSNALDFIHIDDRQAAMETFARAVEHPGQVCRVDIRGRRKDGNWRWVECSVNNLLDEPPVQAIVVNYRDIEDRKRAEAALLESEGKFRTLAEESPNMIFINGGGRVLYANKKAEEVMGYDRQEFYAPDFDFAGLITPESRPAALESFRRHQAGEEVLPSLYTLVTKRGQLVEGLHNTRLIEYEGQPAILGIITDITEERQAGAALRKNEALLKESQRVAAVGHYDLDVVTGFWTSSEMLDEIFGIDEDHPRTVEGWLSIVQADHRAEMVAYLQDFVLKQKNPFDKEYPIVRVSDGSVRWMHGLGRLQFDAEGQPVRMFGVIQDITDRVRAETAVRESEHRYRDLAEEAPIGIYRTAPDGRILFVNPALAHMLGYDTPAELTARSLEVGPFEASYQRADFKRRLEAEGEIRGLEASWTRKDGRRLFVRENARLVRSQDGGGVYYEGTVEDVTEQKQAQDELRRRSEEILLLYEAGRALGQTLDQEALFDLAFQAVARVMDCSDFYVSTFDPATETIRGAYARHGETKLDASSFPVIPLEPEGQGTQSRAIRSGETLYLPDYRAFWHTARSRFLVGEEGVLPDPAPDDADISRSAVLVPLKLEGRVTGVVQVFSPQVDAYQPDQIRFLEALAPQLAAAMANARLFRRAQEEIRERRQAEQAVRQLGEFNEGIVRNMAEGIVLEGTDETFSFVNPAAASMLGFRAEELVGQHLSIILPPDQMAVVRAANERRALGNRDRYELHLQRKDGTRIPVLVSGSPRFEDGAYAGTIAVFTDISELKNAQADIARRAEQLRALYQTSLEISSQPNVQTVLQAIVERAALLLGVQSGGLYLLQPDGETLKMAVVHGMLTEYLGTTLRRGEALSGKALDSGRTVFTEDYMNWPDRSATFERARFRRVLAVPLTLGRRIVGVLHAADKERPGPFTPEEIRLAEMFADQAAIAVENARLLEDARRRADYLQGVTAASTALRAAANRAEMLPIIVEQVAHLLSSPHVAIYLLVSEEEAQMEAGRGALADLVGERRKVPGGLVGEILGSSRAFVTTDASREERVLRKELFLGLKCLAGVPLVSHDKKIGAIFAARETPFEDEEVRLLTAIAEMAGNALNRAGVMETLEQRVAERTSDLAAANARLQELDQLKTAFVSNVSHELRAPITNILLYLDLLAEPRHEDRRLTYMGILRGEGNRLHRLIEDLLTLSRLERGTAALDIEPQVLDALIAPVAASQEAHAHLKQIDLRHEPNPNVPLVSIALNPMVQVLTNLIGNAVNYAPAGAVVTVSTRVDETRRGRCAAIRVHNTQPAIPEEDLPHLFERFYRGRAGLESGEAGTGLGLPICKEIVERHNGWIDVESSLEAGTAFTIWLPLA